MRAVAKSDLTRRARLREAALELFAEHGFEATSTRAVAAAGGPRGTINLQRSYSALMSCFASGTCIVCKTAFAIPCSPRWLG